MFYTQIESIHEQGSTQANHLIVIFENFENYPGQNWEYLEQNWMFLEQIDVFVELPLIRLQRSEDGECFPTITGKLYGMHSIYLVVKEYWRCFKGKFWCSIVLLFHLEAIYLPILKSLVHMYEMWQMKHLWLTQIYSYHWYIPDFIWLVNDLETNPGPAVVDNIDTICTPYSISNILSSLSNCQFF